MNTQKFLVGALLGGIVAFMAGGLFYVVIFKDIMESLCPGMGAVQKEGDMVTLLIGNLASGVLISYIFEKWAGIRTAMGGITAGATLGALIAFSYDCMFHGTTTLMSWSGVLLDTLIYGLIFAISGAVVGWWLGFKRPA